MEHEIIVDIRQLPAITSNFAETKARIGSYLKEFEFVVTEDDYKFAKEKATELNKLADALDTLRKDKIKEVSAPIAAFDAEAKEIHGMIKQTRQSLVDQYTKFELKIKEELRSILENEVQNLWKLHGVEKEFQRAVFDDLVILSNMTSTGKLTKKADDAITARVLADKQLQEKITARLMTLEGESLKAGLVSPLSRHNVNHFLFDENYEDQLKKLIDSELKRQQETERRIAAQMEAKNKVEIDAITAKAAASKPQSAISIQKPVNLTDGDAKFTITVTMEMVTKDMDVELLKKATMKKFEKSGFKSVANIEVQKVVFGRPKTITSQNEGLRATGSAF